MTPPADPVLLLDVDNTLLDNDRIVADLRAHLVYTFGATSAGRYWADFEVLRRELGYADYLGALQRYRLQAEQRPGDNMHLLQMSSYLVDYPFAQALYPQALATLTHLGTLGTTVILSDGDVVFQPRKVQRSGLWRAVGGRVLIYVHKEQQLAAVQQQYPAGHYVMVDDKLRVLTAMKRLLKERLTTVFVRQGHYAVDPAILAAYPAADLAVDHIGDLLGLNCQDLLLECV